MSSAFAHRITLAAHPSTPSDAVQAFEVRVSVSASGVLTFGYSLQADMSRLRVPRGGAPGRTDGLWKHTCFEAFIAPESGGYFEFNFSTARQWAAYRFDAYRDGMAPLETEAPEISVRSAPHSLELDAALRPTPPVGQSAAQRSRLALSAVLEDENGRLSYWAARHAPGKPDFHHPDAFVFEL